MTDIINVFLLALLGSIIALFGGVVFLFSKKLSETLEKFSVPFAAGVLITVSLLGLLPEAVHALGEKAFLYVLISFFVAFLFDNAVVHLHHHSHHHEHGRKDSSILMVLIGDTIHNFIDGVAIAASYMVSPGLGLVTAVSTLLHEVPHEIGDFGILLRAKWKKKDILIVNIASASFTIVGAFFVFFTANNEQLIGALLSLSAGLFLYLGASDFLPELNHKGKSIKANIIPLLIGASLMVATLTAVPHSHDHESEEHGDTHEEDIDGASEPHEI